ncbi:hypothetical protein [uncultured Bacteroides sp.]|uniref:hypothetical protein n=1 Tax=uncultured Bacteroides sp. TaxID=162156 RepID=UPI002AAB6B86|nr:hypothetical protein [uncultured Bacteroides sp.]
MKRYYCLIVLVLFLSQNSLGEGENNSINSKTPKEILILEKALDLILNENKDYICQHKKLTKEKYPLLVNINEVEEFQEFECFTVYFSDTGLSDSILPSYLVKKNGVYCAIYKRKGDTLLKREIPKILFKECEDSQRNEDSWIVLICKSTFKYVVVNNGQVPYKAIKQFQNFSCNHADTKSTQSKIEKGIVDHSMMDSIK